MHKIGSRQQGFGVIELIIALLLAALVVGGGWYVWHKNHHPGAATKTSSSTASISKTTSTAPANTAENPTGVVGYLDIKELGIKVGLTSDISDAYYTIRVVSTASSTGVPAVNLYLHSLDRYPECSSANDTDGVAIIGNFKPGQTSPVDGDMDTAYPDAPLIGGVHYFIQNEQFDCSQGATDMNAIVQAFTAATKTIQVD
ncbi:MAG TPA: hypothetical protein VLH84_03330 [Patescibacteria group bacterium]|nr:hypothetical protein [Patescibacteria group bacterium]